MLVVLCRGATDYKLCGDEYFFATDIIATMRLGSDVTHTNDIETK